MSDHSEEDVPLEDLTATLPKAKEKKKAAAPKKAATLGDLTKELDTDRWFAARKTLVALDRLVLDLRREEGQVRTFHQTDGEETLKALRQCAPKAPLDCTLWKRDPVADQYTVIGGQHTCWALQQLAKDYVRDRRDLPDWLTHMRADVLRHDTPLEVKLAAAGDSQFIQSNVRSLKVTDWARLLLADNIQTKYGDSAEMRLAMSFRQAGWSREGDPVCLP